MKKIFLTLVVLLMVVSPAFSENVTMQTAQRVAQSFLNSKMEGTPQTHLIDFAEKAEFPNFYVFGNEHCFVIISADNGAQPVLGYSIERGFITDSLPDEVRDWLRAYNDEITSAMELRVEATPRIRSEWESLLSGRGLEPKSSTSVNPLITTHWRQYAPYNNLCPADPNAIDGHAKAGCGAIAMAQFMKYWEHPVSGVGEHSYTPSAHPEYGVQYANFGETVYDWDNMLDNYSSGYSDAEALAVATLVYHCGVSVNMNYRPNGSSCNSSVIDDALMAYFDYSPNTKYIFKETNTDTIPDETWKAMLKYDLDMEWPLIYRGQTESADGHIFICDGYDNNDYFHINWGHGGGADGYFAIGSLYENQTNYSYNNAAVFNSIPNYIFNEYNGNDVLIYSINSDFMSVSVVGHVDGSSATGTLTIPETKTFNGVTYPVTAIGNSAFSNCTGFTGSLTIPNSVTSIGSYAFYGCSGFTGSLTIPNSVTAIGNAAFEGCSGFTGSLIIPNSVTTIGSWAFEDCSGFTGSLTIPNSVTAIGNAAFEGCSGFTGSLTISNSVTEIAGYTFYNCSGFTEMLSIPNSVTSIGVRAFEGCSGFSGSLTIPNSVLEIDACAFRGCSGLCGNLIIGSSVTSISYGVFFGCNGFTSIMSHAEIPPTLDNDNPFYSWNSNTPVYVPCGFEEAYSSISWGGFSNFIEWCGGTVTHFAEGWNWWSTYIEQDGIDGLNLLEESLGDHGITIRSQVGYADYYAGYGWYGSLSSINNESSYKIKTDAPCSVSMTGMEAVPSQHPIALSHGWTWMGYVSSTAMDVNEALSGFEAAEGDKLKSQQGYSEYYEGYGWFGSLNTFEPGMGLMYYSNSNQPKTLTYPEGGRGVEQKANHTADNNHWVPDMHAYPHNMTVTAIIELDGEELRAENYELAAFAADECRGSVRLMYVEPIDRWVAFLTVAGEDAVDLNFSLYDMETGMEYSGSEETLNYETDAMVGTMDEPYIVRFRSAASEDENFSHVSIFPNPAKDILTIRGEGIHSVTVFNMTGQSVDKVDADAVETLMLDVNDYEAGVYLLLVQSEYGSSRKVFVKR